MVRMTSLTVALAQIEAIDMARRGIHNEGARVLQERLEGKAEFDVDTARRLFTLICALSPSAASTIVAITTPPSAEGRPTAPMP